MQLEGNNLVQATPEQIFIALQDSAVLAICLPGVKKLEVESEGVFKVMLEVAVGLIKGRFNGKVSILEKLENTALSLKVEMRAAVGIASAIGRVTLYPEAGATRVHWSAEPQLGGMIANLGAGFIGGVAKAQADLFFSKLERELSH